MILLCVAFCGNNSTWCSHHVCDFESVKSCSHFLKSDSRPFNSVRNALMYQGGVVDQPVRRRICDQEVAGSIPGWGAAA